MQDTTAIQSWKSQLRKGAAELAVLAFLGRGEAYGLQILQAITAPGDLGVSEGSIYPLLKRLETSGRVLSRWQDAEAGGNPRKYYALSDEGRATLAEMRASWRSFADALDEIVEDKTHD
jgi:PadR family transcriptional regulator PadR